MGKPSIHANLHLDDGAGVEVNTLRTSTGAEEPCIRLGDYPAQITLHPSASVALDLARAAITAAYVGRRTPLTPDDLAALLAHLLDGFRGGASISTDGKAVVWDQVDPITNEHAGASVLVRLKDV